MVSLLAATASEKELALRCEFRSLDTRAIQPLTDISTPIYLTPRNQEHDVDAGTSQGLPKLRMLSSGPQAHVEPSSHSTRQRQDKGHGANWSPVAVARAQLANEKPSVMQRMDMTVDHCRIARDNRNYRLNSLGVFDGGKNEVRARSMLRVQMHKELSTTSMRLPHTHKEIKLERPDDSINARLEKMCARVLKSIHDDKPHKPAPLQTKGSPQERGKRDHHLHGSPSMTGHLKTSHSMSSQWACDVELSPSFGARSPSRRLHLSASGMSRMGSRAASGRSQHGGMTTRRNDSTSSHASHVMTPNKSSALFGGSNRLEWAANLPPELAAAQIAHLTAITKQHIQKYHSTVIEAQQEVLSNMLADAGIGDVDDPIMGPEQLQEELQIRLKMARPSVVPEEEITTTVKEVSKVVHNTRSIPELIAAALQHCMAQAQELDELKASLPKPEASEKKSRRKPSVPLLSSKKNSGLTAADAAVAATASGIGSNTGASSGTGTARVDSPLWPSLMPQDAGMRMASLRRTYSSQSSTDYEEDGELTDRDGTKQATSPQAQHSPLHATSPSPEASPKSVPTPTTTITPITAKRLAAFKQALEDAAKAVDKGQFTLSDLPTIPPAPTASLHVQARLERLWDMLHLDLTVRLDSVLAFTAREQALHFEHALKLWERCAWGVEKREKLLGELSTLQLGYANNTLGFVSITNLTDKCVELHKVTLALIKAADHLQAEYGLVLRYDGDTVYPGPDAVSADDMIRFMEWLRDTPSTVRVAL